MHGIYVMSPSGMIPSPNYVDMYWLKPYYFVEGVMMDGIIGYKAALKLHDIFMDDLTNENLDKEYLEDSFSFDISKFSKYPVVPLLGSESEETCYTHNHRGPNPYQNFYSGSFSPIFSWRTYEFLNGELKGIYPVFTQKTAIHTKDDNIDVTLYVNAVKQQDKKDFVFSIGADLLNTEIYYNPLSC